MASIALRFTRAAIGASKPLLRPEATRAFLITCKREMSIENFLGLWY
ncbi:MAG: hypothetical protein HZB76_04385 [Chlamydiae bacterium]|nr:hypothetical protein [Chlamydiota bacterium]